MKTHLTILLASVTFAATASAQTAIGDANDKTALILDVGGALSLNLTDSSAKVGFVHDISGEDWLAGMELSAKAKNGFGPLFDGENVSPETGAAFSVGRRYGTSRSKRQVAHGKITAAQQVANDDGYGGWTSLRVGYTRGSYKLYAPTLPVGQRVSDRAEDMLDAAVYWNMPLKSPNAVFGLSFGARRATNYEDLKKIAVKETTVVEVSGATTVTSEKSIEAREGTFSTFTQWECNADFFWIPGKLDNRFGVDFFARAQQRSGHTYISPGIGLFVLKEGSPGQAIAGLTVQYDDRENKTVVGFAFGYPFK